MTSNIAMTLLIALHFTLSAFALAAFEAHRHSATAAVASLHRPR